MKNQALIPALLITLLPSLSLRSQEAGNLFNNLVATDTAAVTTLALYPEGVRKTLLEACTYPEALVKMEALQKKTSASFREAFANYPKDDQQKLWDLSRYQGLIGKLAEGSKKPDAEIDALVAAYPSEIQATAALYGKQKRELLVKANALSNESQREFDLLLKDYPEPARHSFRELQNYPEAIDLLVSNMKMSVLAGDLYRQHPQLLQRKLDSLSTAHARQHATDLEAWKAGLEKDPEAKKQMESAAKEFAKEQGYKEEELTVVNETRIVNYVVTPYPYWWGYPAWYGYSYWYPRPYWYDLGYYWGPHGIVYIGFPSPYFTFWFFHHHHHHYHYNHFTDHCLRHYYGHRHSAHGFRREVSGWIRKNERDLPKNFLANDPQRPGRIKEFGRFEMDYDKAAASDPGKKLERVDYLRSNASSYPALSPVLTEQPRPATMPVDKKEGVKPAVVPSPEKPRETRPVMSDPQPRPVQPKVRPQTKPVVQPKAQPQPQPKVEPRVQPKVQPKVQPAPAPQRPAPKDSKTQRNPLMP